MVEAEADDSVDLVVRPRDGASLRIWWVRRPGKRLVSDKESARGVWTKDVLVAQTFGWTSEVRSQVAAEKQASVHPVVLIIGLFWAT